MRKPGIRNGVEGWRRRDPPRQEARNAMRQLRRTAAVYSLVVTTVVVSLFLAEGRFALEDFVALGLFELLLGLFAAAPWCIDRSSPTRATLAQHLHGARYDGPLTETRRAVAAEEQAFHAAGNSTRRTDSREKGATKPAVLAFVVTAVVLGVIVAWKWSSPGNDEPSPAVVMATGHQGHHVERGHPLPRRTETSCDRGH